MGRRDHFSVHLCRGQDVKAKTLTYNGRIGLPASEGVSMSTCFRLALILAPLLCRATHYLIKLYLSLHGS